MARTKQTARVSTGGKAPRKALCTKSCRWPVCYDLGYGKRHILKSKNGRHSQRPKSHTQDTASSKIIANFKGAKDFPHFVKLPYEIQNRVWEMLAEEPRIVAVNTKTNSGLHSSIPPILHTCSESRAVGLKHYTLAFESSKSQPFTHQGTHNAEHKINVLQEGVYFNFERDTLYFRENWNKNVEGAWCCLSRFYNLVNEGDLKRVRRVGLDVNVRVCSLKTSDERCHLPNFAFWDALEILYLGYEDVRLGSDCPISSSKLESKDYKDFMLRYRMNPCLRNMEWFLQDVKATEDVENVEDVETAEAVDVVKAADAVEYLRNEVPTSYHGCWKKPDGFLGKLELVSIKHL